MRAGTSSARPAGDDEGRHQGRGHRREITIQGERKQEKEEKREGYYYGERAYSSYYRAIPLPEGADPAKATAEFHNGVLEVTMPAPKKPEKKSRRLEVQEKK